MFLLVSSALLRALCGQKELNDEGPAVPLTEDHKISRAIRELRGFVVYEQDPDGASFDSPDEGPFPPLDGPETRVLCGEILRAIREGEPFPPGVDRAALQTAVYAVKHNPKGFDRATVGAILNAAWQTFAACPHPAEKAKREQLLGLLVRLSGLLGCPAAKGGEEKVSDTLAVKVSDTFSSPASLEGAAEAAARLAQAVAARLPAGPEAEELREACAELVTRAYGRRDLSRLCEVLEKHRAALEPGAEGPGPDAPKGPARGEAYREDM